MSSPALDVAQLLATEGIGTYGTNLHLAKDPGGTKELSITVYDTTGGAPNPKFARDFPNIQILVYSPEQDYVTGWSKCEEIKEFLLGTTTQVIGTDCYFAFNMRSDIHHIGVDQENRFIFTMNFRLIIDRDDIGNRISI